MRKVWLLGISWIFLGVATLMFLSYIYFISKQPHTSISEPSITVWDWVVWEQNEAEIIAKKSYHTATNSPGNGIKPGDKLLGIEYAPIPNLPLLKEIHQAGQPGKLLIYQIERQEINRFSPERLNVFVALSLHPFASWPEIPWLWTVQIWLTCSLCFVSIIILLILFPLFRTNPVEQWPVILPGILSIAFTGLIAFRNLRILLDIPSELLSLEYSFCLLYLIFSSGLAISAAATRISWKWLAPSLIIGILICLLGLPINKISNYFGKLEPEILLFQSLFAWVHLGIFFFHGEKKTSGFNLGGGVFSILACIFLLLALNGNIAYSEWIPIALCFSFLIQVFPFFWLSFSRLKFGKTAVILSRTLQYLLLGGGLLILYLIVHELGNTWLSPSPYQSLVEVIFLILLILVFRTLFLKYHDRLLKYGISLQQKKKEEFNQFLLKIPRYAHSQDLLKDTVTHLQNYFEAQPVWVVLESLPETESLLPSELDDQLLSELWNTPEIIWSRNKELSPRKLNGNAEQLIISAGVGLAFPFRMTHGKSGVLLVGRKKRGVFNLEEVDQLKRIVLQIKLSLDILYLLENEKLLMQKTMEANMTALRSQINPHFLFNTLNTIAALIHESPEMAEKAVENLAFIFRYTLKTSGENFVTIGNELTLVGKYLEIEQFRFGEHLSVELSIQPGCEDVLIPALVIQTLVENCIKHGIAKILENGIIKIIVRASENIMTVTVEDNGPGIRSDRITKGTGLNNIHSRLHSLYDVPDILIFENTGNGTKVTLHIPIRRNEK